MLAVSSIRRLMMTTDLKIGAHVPAADPLSEAEARDAEVIQIFVSNPQQ